MWYKNYVISSEIKMFKGFHGWEGLMQKFFQTLCDFKNYVISSEIQMFKGFHGWEGLMQKFYQTLCDFKNYVISRIFFVLLENFVEGGGVGLWDDGFGPIFGGISMALDSRIVRISGLIKIGKYRITRNPQKICRILGLG